MHCRQRLRLGSHTVLQRCRQVALCSGWKATCLGITVLGVTSLLLKCTWAGHGCAQQADGLGLNMGPTWEGIR